ncbi:MAG: Xaa-Pro peptidase family protein [Desulfurococcaceae archaeon]
MSSMNLNKLIEIIRVNELSGLILVSHENIEYFLDLEVVGESPVIVYVSDNGLIEIYVPVLDYYRYGSLVENRNIEVYAVSKTLKPSDMKIVELDWRDIIEKKIVENRKIGVDKSHSSPLSGVLSAISSEKIVDISKDIDNYRMLKEEWEIEAISEAIDIVGDAIHRIIDNLHDRITEVEIAGLFEYYSRKRGVKRFAFEPLVLFKPGNSYPHNLPSNTELGINNLILLDLGVKYRNRCCDLTRMVIWGSVSSEEKNVLEIVSTAVDKAIDIIQPGVKASEVDGIARKYIEEKGFGNRFIHGLGHGIGVVVHEKPFIRVNSDIELKPGMVFTIEPGIYFNNKYGVRIEENVLVTKTGVKVLSSGIDRVFT